MHSVGWWIQKYGGPTLVVVTVFYTIASITVYRVVERIDEESLDVVRGSLRVGGGGNGPLFRRGGLWGRTPEIDIEPLDDERIPSIVRSLRLPHDPPPFDDTIGMTYDIYHCPPQPPKNYPFAWNVIDVLGNWNPDITEIPDKIYNGLCVFDWNDSQHRVSAKTYREAEKPFVVVNHPQVLRTAARWSESTEYLSKRIGKMPIKNEHSTNNHFMYWKLRKHFGRQANQVVPGDWKPPTEMVKLTFDEWHSKALEVERFYNRTDASERPPTEIERWYFRLNADWPPANFDPALAFVYEDLPYFQADKPSFFMVDPQEQRGINCRFGMKGVIAETHYDYSRNFIIILRGQKRYILAHPEQCRNMVLYPPKHPSARHSAVNWSDPEDWERNPAFQNAKVNEVVMQAGDALYLPTAWFHFIVSLNLNYQCNARSGVTFENQHYIKQCGF